MQTYQTIYADPPWMEAGGGKIKRGADRHYPLMKTKDIMELPVKNFAADNCHLYLWVTNNFLIDGLKVMKSWGFTYKTKIDWFKGRAPITEWLRIYWKDANMDNAIVPLYHAHYSLPNIAIALGKEESYVRQILKEHNIKLRSKEAADYDAEADIDHFDNPALGQYFRGTTESCLFGVKGSLPYKIDETTGKRCQGVTNIISPRREHSRKPYEMRMMIERVSHGPYLEMFAREKTEGWDTWGNELKNDIEM